MKEKVLLAHPGTQYSHHLAKQLVRLGCLSEFWTGFALNRNTWPSRLLLPWLISTWRDKIANRIIDELPAHCLRTTPLIEWQALRKIRQGKPVEQVLQERNRLFQERIPATSIRKVDAVIGFDTSSQILASRAKSEGKIFILDQSIAHPVTCTKIAAVVQENFPKWKNSWRVKLPEEIASEKAEHQLADLIVVPSRFVANSLIDNGVPKAKIRINPFGTDTVHFYPSSTPPKPDPFIFLYVGSLTARKGLPLLLNAWQHLNPSNAELWIVGTALQSGLHEHQQLESTRWFGQVSRQDLPHIFRQAHVFVFPSFFEGLAQVQLEAAACGLPIIATTNSGSEDIIEEGITGFTLEPGNQQQLIDRMHEFLKHPSLSQKMRFLAVKRSSNWGWATYGDRWQQILRNIFDVGYSNNSSDSISGTTVASFSQRKHGTL